MIFGWMSRRKAEEAAREAADRQQRDLAMEGRLRADRLKRETLQSFLALKSVRAQGDGCEVKAVGLMDYQSELDSISEADEDGAVKRLQTATLYPEPDNIYDENAVQVVIAGEPVGYLSAANAKKYRPVLELAASTGRKVTCSAEIVGGFIKSNGEQANFGVHLSLQSPAALRRLLDDRPGAPGQ